MKKVASILTVVVLFAVAIIATQTDSLDTLIACDDCWGLDMETLLACDDCWGMIDSKGAIA